jgi:hypothetical protein
MVGDARVGRIDSLWSTVQLRYQAAVALLAKRLFPRFLRKPLDADQLDGHPSCRH